MSIVITSSTRFVGTSFVIGCPGRHQEEPVTHSRVLTYAGNLENLARLQGDARQCVERVGEDDIVRFHDQYGRA